jgi:hypothetical protein
MIPDIFGINTASIRMDEIALPSNPTANQGLIYLRDVAGTTTPFFLDSSGTETSMIGGGGVTNQISQLDSNVTVTDVGVGLITMDVDGTQRYSIQANRADYADLPIFGFTALSFTDTIDAAAGTILTQNQTDFTMNFPDNADIYNIDFNSIVGFSVDLLRTRLHSNTPNTISAALSLFRDDPSPAPADALGDINFDGRDSAGNFTTYADIIGGIVSATSTAEEGRLTIRLQDGGPLQQVMRITLNELELTDMTIQLNEIALPSNPALNQGLIYLRDVAGTTTPFFLDSSGTETSMIGAGGAGANTALSNLVSVAINTSLLPNADGTINLGSAAFSWLDIFTERLRVETGGALTSTANQINSDAGGMNINVPAGDTLTLKISGSDNIFFSEDEIAFAAGSAHRIQAQNTSLQIDTENTTDSLEFRNGTSRIDPTLEIDSSIATFATTDSSSGRYVVAVLQNNTTPIIQNGIGAFEGWSENSASTNIVFGRLEYSTGSSVTSGSENGRSQQEVMNNGIMTPFFRATGHASGGIQMAFFGVTEVVRQNPASDTLANLYTALRNYGLLV